jgi:hypothetical protein
MNAFPRPFPVPRMTRAALALVTVLFLSGQPCASAATLRGAAEPGAPQTSGSASGTAERPVALDKQATSTNGITLGRPIQWSLVNGSVTLQTASICNDGTFYNPTATLRLELWASSSPFSGGTFSGYKLAQSGGLSGLAASQCYNNYNSGLVSLLVIPPDGVYYVTLFLDMFTSSSVDDGYSYVDYGQFTTTITVSGGVISNTPSGGGSCVANATTLCIDDSPGDRRYRVQVSYHTSQGGGLAGNGTPVSLATLGVNQGGLFWFFSANNPELLIKVLNGCSVNNRHWVFASAGTNVGGTITVTDTATGAQKSYTNPDLTAFPTIQDTAAFPCPNGSN